MEGATGFCTDAAGEVVGSDADFFGDGGKVERLVEPLAEEVNGALHRIAVAEGGAESGGLSGLRAEEADGGPFEDAGFGKQALGPGSLPARARASQRSRSQTPMRPQNVIDPPS